MAVRGWTIKEAIDHLRGLQVPAARPKLRLVHQQKSIDPEKLTSAQVKSIWESFDQADPGGPGEQFLEQRGLERAVGKSDVLRFAPGHDRRTAKIAQRGWSVAMLTSDVTGNPLGIQLRLTRKPVAKEPKVLSVTGSTMAGAFLGQPALIEAADTVLVAEGMPDTLAVMLWGGDRAVTVGAPGMGHLAKLAEELKGADISVAGKMFILFPQNDRPQNKSRREFKRLAQRLTEMGAWVVMSSAPDDHEDIADWLQHNPGAEWPPRAVREAIDRQQDINDDGQSTFVAPKHLSVPIPQRVQSDLYAQNFRTLLSVLDDSVSREAIMGPGELFRDEMTGGIVYSGKPIGEVDLSVIRLGLESESKSTDGKPLMFGEEDIWKALSVLAARRSVHPVREWLSSLQWDGVERIASRLPQALGHEPDTLQAWLLRKWFISIIARPMRPGCQVDTVLVLVGPQGIWKSSFFGSIGGQWFTDEPMLPGDKDGKMLLRKNWIVEWAELASMRKAKDQEAVKAFLSQRIDQFRPPYGRDIIEAPRGCVIVGSTNDPEFLHDRTGSRRFWPIRVNGIDLPWVQANREQLLAEAFQLYMAGEQWWLEPEYDRLLTKQNVAHEDSDAWEQLVEDYLEKHCLFEVTIAAVLDGAIAKHASQWTHGDEIRIGRILQGMGFRSHQVRREGSRVRIYERGDPQGHLPLSSQ